MDLSKLKPAVFAHYNTLTKQINAPPGSYAWRHEWRHAWQDGKGLLDLADWLYNFAAPLTLFFFFYYPALAIWPIGIHYALYVAIEADAHLFALTHE